MFFTVAISLVPRRRWGRESFLAAILSLGTRLSSYILHVILALQMMSKSVESKFLDVFLEDIRKAIVPQPWDTTIQLFQEYVVSKEVLSDVVDSTKPLSEKSIAIMRAVQEAVEAEPKKMWVLITALERITWCGPVVGRMRDALRAHGIEGAVM